MLFFPESLGYLPDSQLHIVLCPSREIGHGINGEILLLRAPKREDEVADAEVEGEGDGEGEEEGL